MGGWVNECSTDRNWASAGPTCSQHLVTRCFESRPCYIFAFAHPGACVLQISSVRFESNWFNLTYIWSGYWIVTMQMQHNILNKQTHCSSWNLIQVMQLFSHVGAYPTLQNFFSQDGDLIDSLTLKILTCLMKLARVALLTRGFPVSKQIRVAPIQCSFGQ